VSQRRALLQAEFERNLTHRRRVSILTALSRGTAALQLLTGGGGGSSAAAAAAPNPEEVDVHLEAFQAECWAVTRMLCACGAPGADTGAGADGSAAGPANSGCSPGVSEGDMEVEAGAGWAAARQRGAGGGVPAGPLEHQGSSPSAGALTPRPPGTAAQQHEPPRPAAVKAEQGASAEEEEEEEEEGVRRACGAPGDASSAPPGADAAARHAACVAAHSLGVTPREFLEG
jgi:hypothetical protein